MKHSYIYIGSVLISSTVKKVSYYVKRLFFIVLNDNNQIFSLIMTMEYW